MRQWPRNWKRRSPMTLKTPADGAAAERQAILQFIRRRAKGKGIVATLDYMEIEQWIRERHTRYRARPGGLGRKPPAK